MMFDKNWDEITEKALALKKNCSELKLTIDTMTLKYEQLTDKYSVCCNKIRVTASQCSDYQQKLIEIPEKSHQLREAFDNSDGILTYLSRLLDYEKKTLKEDDSSRDIYFHFYTEIVSVLASKMNTLAQQLNELQKYSKQFDKEDYQKVLLQNLGGMPDERVDNQFSLKSNRIINQVSKLIREINKKYQKKGLPFYHQYSLSEDTSKLAKLKHQSDELTVELMLMESKVEEAEKLLAELENIHQQQKQDLKGDSAYTQYAAVYNKLRLLFTHDQLVRLNSSVYTKIEYTQLVKVFCSRVRDALKTQPIKF